MRRFGSSITYKVVDLINIYTSVGDNDFDKYRDEYLKAENEDKNSTLYKMTCEKVKKLIDFINLNIDSLTCENEMKMECYFNQDEPAFIDDEVNTKLFNFKYADIIYDFAMKNNLQMRIHTIVWYRHFPKQLHEYLKHRTKEDKERLTLSFIKAYMEELARRYPKCYCVDVINEMAADPDELNMLKAENQELYEVDSEGIRIDDWYKYLGKDYYLSVFNLAREVFGSEKQLFYNDNNEGNKQKQQIYATIINKIKNYEKEYGIKLLDGFGLQCHFWGDETPSYIKEIFDFYATLNLKIQVTEFDVSCHESEKRQLEIFNSVADIIKNYKIDSFTMWGLNDDLSWLGEFKPLLIDSNYDMKEFAEKYIMHFSNKRVDK